MNMRNFHRIAAFLLALLLSVGILSGCGQEPSAPAEQTTEQTTEQTESESTETEGEFGLAYVAEYGMNPYRCTCITNRPIISLVFESLFTVNEVFQPEPLLCDKFGVSEDGMTYLLTLRQEARFSDGSPVTAQDVVSSLRAASNSAYYGDRFHFVRSFSAADTYTVRIDLTTPYETLPLLLDVAICKDGTADTPKPVGSGPFRMTASNRRLNRVEDWWQGKAPVIDCAYITLQNVKKPIEVRDSFEFGTTNLVLADPNSAASVGYRCDYELWNCNTTVMQYLGFNTARGAFSSRELRRAVTWLVDRDTACAKIFNGFAMPTVLPCSPQCGLYDKELAARYAYAPTSFAEWRKTAGLPTGTKAELVVWSADYSRVELANLIADTLSAYGIGVEVNAVDYEQYKSRLRSGNFDLFIGEVRLSDNFDLTEFFAADGDLNFGSITNSEAYQAALNMLANSGNSYDLYELILQSGLICPVLFKSYAVMVTRGSISALQPAVDNVIHLPGGRTLADAAVTYEELTNRPTEETAPTAEP